MAQPRRSRGVQRQARQRSELLDLCGAIAQAYAVLHARGVLHGRVHPRHVLVDGDGSVGLLDFSLAAPASRAGHFDALSAPEQAESVLRGGKVVAPTALAEQYSLAALLYLLVTGHMHVELGRRRADAARAIHASAPRRFSDLGMSPWPDYEAVLAHALRKDPAKRYASIEEFARALGGLSWEQATASARPRSAPLANALAAFRRDATGTDESLMALRPPTCSINSGAAGVAYALTRLGKATGDTAAFEQAERWLAVAERRRTDADAFEDGDELIPDTVGTVSPYHNASGIAAARALLSGATGDHAGQQAALDEFRVTTAAPCANLDLTVGRSSVLLFAALLLADAEPAWPAAQRLAPHGDELCAGIWRDLPQAAIAYNGVAHGWAGIVYATLMWAHAREGPAPPGTRAVLTMLSTIAEPSARGARWPLTSPDGPGSDVFWPGWCHGNAGYVFLWNRARTFYADDRFAELADRAAWLIERPSGITSLCCGAAGQAYAALNHYRTTGEDRWRSRAFAIAHAAARQGELAGDATGPLSLYKGHVGLALLATELECPERAAMPLFEFEPHARSATTDCNA